MNELMQSYTVQCKPNVPLAEKFKAPFKASKATQYIGYGKKGSSTKLYEDQLRAQGIPVNSGKYGPQDVVFVSVNGNPDRVDMGLTIGQCIDALQSGATLLTDSEEYLKTSTYNKGENTLAVELTSRGYIRTTSRQNKYTAEWKKDKK